MTCKIPVSDPILPNSLNLPGNPNKAKEKDPVLTAAMMEKLKKEGETRSELVEILLSTEIFGIPQSLSANQYSLYHGTKSYVASHFRAKSKPTFHETKSGIVIEFSILLLFSTFKERLSWVKTMPDFFIMSIKSAEPYSKCDIVTDIYFLESLKEAIRDNRGSDGLVFPLNDSTPFPVSFETNNKSQ